MKTFVHEFEDASQDGCLSIEAEAVPPARIEFSVERDGGIWLAANRAGFAHLARVFAELAMGDYEDGHHIHQSLQFRDSASHPELSVEVRREWD